MRRSTLIIALVILGLAHITFSAKVVRVPNWRDSKNNPRPYYPDEYSEEPEESDEYEPTRSSRGSRPRRSSRPRRGSRPSRPTRPVESEDDYPTRPVESEDDYPTYPEESSDVPVEESEVTPVESEDDPTPTNPGNSLSEQSLAYQNPFRAQVGVAPFTWSSSLASTAQAWADRMASSGNFQHSGQRGVGENIAYGTTSRYGVQGLFKMWTDEKAYYIPGSKTPNSSSNGKAVGHYTQIVWSTTKQVGCGVATRGSVSYLCCQYSPAGNIRGKSAY